MADFLKNTLQSTLRAFLIVCPWIGYKEKEDRLKQKLSFRKAKREYVSAEMDFVHRGRFRGRLATLIMFISIACWGLLFFLGATISSKPFLLTTNITSARVVSSTATIATPPTPVVETQTPFFEMMRLLPAIDDQSQVAPSPSNTPPAGTKASPSAESTAQQRTNAEEPLAVDRVTAYLSYFGIPNESGWEWAHIVCSATIAILTSTLTNMLMLCCAAALVGALVNYAVQGLKQSRQYAVRKDNETSIFGHRRVFTSLSGTLVTGLGLGFASFLASIAGIAFLRGLFPSDPLASYQASVCSASLLALIVALLPDQALLFIESRVNNATRLATAARRNEEQDRSGSDCPKAKRLD